MAEGLLFDPDIFLEEFEFLQQHTVVTDQPLSQLPHQTVDSRTDNISPDVSGYYSRSSVSTCSSSFSPTDQSTVANTGEFEEDAINESEAVAKNSTSNGDKKPDLSYVALIADAILNSPQQKLLLGDIYDHLMATHPFFKNENKSWRNSIRHNLSLNDCFIKDGKSDLGKGYYWAIHPQSLDKFKKGDFRRPRSFVREAAPVPLPQTPFWGVACNQQPRFAQPSVLPQHISDHGFATTPVVVKPQVMSQNFNNNCPPINSHMTTRNGPVSTPIGPMVTSLSGYCGHPMNGHQMMTSGNGLGPNRYQARLSQSRRQATRAVPYPVAPADTAHHSCHYRPRNTNSTTTQRYPPRPPASSGYITFTAPHRYPPRPPASSGYVTTTTNQHTSNGLTSSPSAQLVIFQKGQNVNLLSNVPQLGR